MEKEGESVSEAGLLEIQKARAAGFSDEEIEQGILAEKAEAAAAGFSPAEVDAYYGRPHFDDAPVKALLNENHKAATTPSGDGKTLPKPITNFTEAIEAGLQMSVTGLIARGKAPEFAVDENTPRSSRIAANITTLAGDIPAMVGGYLAGGGQITGMAGAFALPTGIRKILMDKYEKGEVQGFSDFWDRFAGVAIDTAKSWITGAATGAVGKVVGAADIPSKVLKGAAVTSSELATMVTVGNALEGQIPNADDFIDTAIALGFVKGSAAMAKKLRNIYAQTGVTPAEVARDAQADPTVQQDLASGNMEIPRRYQTPAETSGLPATAQPGGHVAAATAKSAQPAGVKDALAKVGDHISTASDQPKGLTWEEIYTRGLDDLNPIREAVKRAGKLGGKVEQVEGEIIPPSEEAPLRRTPLAGPTPTAIEGPTSNYLEAIKSEGGPLSKEFLETRAGVRTPEELTESGIQDPYKLMRLLRGSIGKAAHFLEMGTTDFHTYKTNGESLRDILKPIKDLDNFRNYVTARRATELHERGIESGIPRDVATAAVKEGNARFKEASDRLISYQNRVTQYLRDSGIISQEQYAAMLEANKLYVPFFRLVGASEGLGKGISVKNPIKAIEGSEKMILDPLESVIKNTYAYVSLAERNAAGSAFIKMADKTNQPGLFYKKVLPQEMKIDLTEREIRRLFREFVEIRQKSTTTKTTQETRKGGTSSSKTETGSAEGDSKAFTMIKNRVFEALKARGFSDGEANQMIDRLMAKGATAGKTTETITETVERVAKEVEKTVFEPELNIRLPHEAATIFRAVGAPLKNNEIAVFEKGKRQVYSLEPDVAAAFKALDAETANLFVKLIAIPAQTLRAGAILSPDFMARNAMRDQLSAFILSKGGYFPIFDFVRGALSLVKQDEAFGNWLKAGGANAAMVSLDRQYLSQHIFKLSKETGLMERAWNVVKSPLEGLRVTSELIENATRLGEFKRLTGPESTKAGLQEAAFASREVTLDFARIGANMRAVNMISAFTNAQLQGVDRMIRAFGENPVGTTAKIGAAITLPSLLLWWANHDDPRWKDIPNWQKDLFWIVMTKDHIYRIPKPFEVGLIFGTLPERAMEKFFTDNPHAFRDFEKVMLDAFLPNLVPQAAQPIIEQFSNKSLFTGTPIIPKDAEKLLPEYQYNEYTTELTRVLGRIVGAFPGMRDRAIEDEQSLIGGTARALQTPALMENYIRAWTGGLGMYALQLADKALRETGTLPDPVTPTPTLSDIPIIKAFVVRYPSASMQSIQDFYREHEAQQRYFTTMMRKAEEGDPAAQKLLDEHSERMGSLTAMKDALSMHSQLIRTIYKNPEIPADEKRQVIDTLYFRMMEIANAGNEAFRQLREGGEP